MQIFHAVAPGQRKKRVPIRVEYRDGFPRGGVFPFKIRESLRQRQPEYSPIRAPAARCPSISGVSMVNVLSPRPWYQMLARPPGFVSVRSPRDLGVASVLSLNLPMTLGVYIQVPFCQTRCTYCNFHTGVVSRDRYEPYANAICREIASSDLASGPKVDTVYFGGGTPSLLDPALLARMLDAVRRASGAELTEVTLEADPETITPQKASAWFAAGFNRVSLGAQSFNDRELQAAAACIAARTFIAPPIFCAPPDFAISAWT